MRVREEKPEPAEHHFTREVTAGLRHVWETLPLRQVVGGIAVALLVVGFTETLIFSVIAALGEPPSFFGVFATIQGVGSIAGGVTAAAVLRRLGEMRLVGLGLALFAFADLCLIVPSLGVVLVAGPIAGVGVAWAIVGFTTALQTRTPLAIQGRVSAAADLTLSIAQTTSIATGALLSTVVDYRILFAVMAAVVVASASYLLDARGADPGSCDDGGVTELVPLRRNRDFVLYQSGGLLSTFGSGISGIAYPLLTLALTNSAAKTGYVGAVEFLPLVLLSAPAGVAADRFDRRRLMIAADAAGATALAVLGTAVLTGHATLSG